MYLIYSVVLLFAMQQSQSVIHVHAFVRFLSHVVHYFKRGCSGNLETLCLQAACLPYYYSSKHTFSFFMRI